MKKFKKFFVNSFFSYLAIELVEEVLENLISLGISSLLIKGVSTLFVVSLTQGVKVLIKRIVKQIIYKEGNDKVEKIKKVFSWLNANKCTLLGIGTGALTAVSGAGIIDVSTFPALMIGTFNITPVLYYGVLGVLIIVASFFPETIEKFKARVDAIKAEKAQKALVKEAEKELANEEKVANQTQAEQEKAKAKAEAEKLAKQEKEKADAEHKAKVEAIKRQLKAEKAKAENTKNV